jgi:3-deoxy-manno-octulosonate cytidylyltransferase (CMP-KDO synthetase)
MASTRLPDKLTLAAAGKPILQHVIERTQMAAAKSEGRLAQVVVAYDDERLRQIALGCGVRAIATGSHHACGTTRIAEAMDKLGDDGIDFVVNVQGDEPEIAPEAILAVADALLADERAPMATLATAMPKGSEGMKANPNAVKVVIDRSGRAIYFSRAPVPYDRARTEEGEALWHHHLGVYAYRRAFLSEFAALPPSSLEAREGLEQLRAIEHGHAIRVGIVPAAWAAKGIDTPEDFAAFARRAG